MLSAIRRRVTYANVGVTLALVFAMSGGAYAASRYVISSTKQISPKVLKALQGKVGREGASGAQGSPGATGPQGAAGAKGETGAMGPQGPAGPVGKNGENGKDGTTGFTEKLPSGKTLKGEWLITSTSASEFIGTSASFGIPVENEAGEAPTPHLVRANGKEVIAKGTSEIEEVTPVNCLGSVAKPSANPGSLCVYEHEEVGLQAGEGDHAFPMVCSLATEGLSGCLAEAGTQPEADSSGFGLIAIPSGSVVLTDGTWAVTAE
jgi:hypothetical protein